MVREEGKIVFGAQELLKHVLRQNSDGTRHSFCVTTHAYLLASPRYIFDPAIAAWMLDSELASFEFPALLQHFLPSLAAQDEKDKAMQAPYATQLKDKRANARLLFKDMVCNFFFSLPLGVNLLTVVIVTVLAIGGTASTSLGGGRSYSVAAGDRNAACAAACECVS